MVQCVLHFSDLGFFDCLEVRSLREEASDLAVDVLVGASLPGRIWISEKEAGPEFCRDVLVLSELAAVVSGDGVNDLIAVLQSIYSRPFDSFAGLSRELSEKEKLS